MPDMHDIWKKIEKFGRYGGYGGLKTWVLYTLNDQPKNGAEIMNSIQSMSYGSWRPSPGSIYPMLNKMVDEGLIRKRDDGRYELVNEAFQENLQGQNKSHTIESALNKIDSYISYLEDLPRDKVRQHGDRIEAMIDRIQKLKEKTVN